MNKSNQIVEIEEPEVQAGEPAEARVVYTQAPVALGRVVREEEGVFVVKVGGDERALPLDPAVDPELVREAMERGARVIIDSAEGPAIVGVVATRRALSIDPEGRVEARLRSLELRAEEELLLATPGAFLRAHKREVEIYGSRVLSRARDLHRILAAMVKIN